MECRDKAPLTLSIVLYEQFEILDAAGPLQLLSMIPERIGTMLLGPCRGPVAGRAGHALVADYGYGDAPDADILLVPGSKYGALKMTEDRKFLDWLVGYASHCRYVMSVCTGSAILAQAGLLEGYRATSNKEAFNQVKEFGVNVQCVEQARWVGDRDRWTSSGVSAGIDMTVAFLSHLYGSGLAGSLAREAELIVRKDPGNDPFARSQGLKNTVANRLIGRKQI